MVFHYLSIATAIFSNTIIIVTSIVKIANLALNMTETIACILYRICGIESGKKILEMLFFSFKKRHQQHLRC